MNKIFFPTSRGYIELYEKYDDTVAILFFLPAIFCDIILLPASLLMFLVLKIKNKFVLEKETEQCK